VCRMGSIVGISDLFKSLSPSRVGQEMYQLVSELYPICRSITGNGFRKTLDIIRGHIDLRIQEIPTGTNVFDWTVPKEWNIKDAYIKNLQGERIIDFNKSNLHVLNYSVPINRKISLDELKEYIFTLPAHPDWIPYRTSYYHEKWGFCLSHNQFLSLKEEEYEVFIDSSLEDGHLTYGEYYLKGESPDEILISCHACHPSLCNDNLSGVALATFIAKYFSNTSTRYSYRFLFIPGTIGSIAWLCLNELNASRIKHGLVVACVGDGGKFTYKKSRRGNTEIDQAVLHVLKHYCKSHEVIDFFPYGYDERQYCSPGFNLPVGCLMRTPHGRFPEYHTSADDLNYIKPDYLGESFEKYSMVLGVLEDNAKYINQNPKCEPQLGKRGLYPLMPNTEESMMNQLAILWVLNLSDGESTLLDIADRSKLSFNVIKIAADALFRTGLLKGFVGKETRREEAGEIM